MRSSYLEPLEARIAPATLTIAPAVDEGDSVAVKHIKVSLDANATADVTLNYEIQPGTAQLDHEYSLVNGSSTGSIVIASGTKEAFIDVIINGNGDINPDSTFKIQINNPPAEVTGASSPFQVAIWDDDRTVNFTPESLNQVVNEGNVGGGGVYHYSAVLSDPAQHDIKVVFQTTAHGNQLTDATSEGGRGRLHGCYPDSHFHRGFSQPQQHRDRHGDWRHPPRSR